MPSKSVCSRTIARWLNVLADAEVTGTLLDERVLKNCQFSRKIEKHGFQHTFAAFLEDFAALPPGKGAGAVFFPFGAYEANYHHVPGWSWREGE